MRHGEKTNETCQEQQATRNDVYGDCYGALLKAKQLTKQAVETGCEFCHLDVRQEVRGALIELEAALISMPDARSGATECVRAAVWILRRLLRFGPGGEGKDAPNV